MNRVLDNNQVTIYGEILNKFEFNNEIYGEKFYLTYVGVTRKSGYVDVLPVIVSDRLLDIREDLRGLKVTVKGQYRSHNKHESNRTRLILSIFAVEIEFVDQVLEGCGNNDIYLEGTICKEPVYRVTPEGREITDILIAVNRPYGKSDYIPCICWRRTARFASGLEVGSRCRLRGRIQSRPYTKVMPDGKVLDKVAYEVSLSVMERIARGENNLQ